MTDEKTAAALAARSERAVADVIARYSRHLYTVAAAALRGVGTEQDAEEAAEMAALGTFSPVESGCPLLEETRLAVPMTMTAGNVRSALKDGTPLEWEMDGYTLRVTQAEMSEVGARFALERIGEVDPKPGEYEELEELLPRSEHAEVLVATANDAHASLAAEGGALDAVNGAVAELSRMATVDRKLGDIADALSDACISLEDCANELRAYRDGIAFDPRELARMRERYSDLKGLLRQWGPTMDDVFAMRDRSQELLSLVDDGDEQIKKAREALGAAERELFAAAKALKRARNTAAPRFCHEVGRQMARLEMGSAVWESRDLPRAEWTPVGPSSYELLYRSGAGLTPRPLRRIASGGELSRVMLASKVVLGNADGVDTLVFDEVDAGVGGSTARALAGVLADLAATHQVIVVTHLAQVAVMADKHYVVSKEPGEVPQTHLDEVTGEARTAEIARMLSGDQSEASLAHAKQMLEEARG